MAKPIFLASQIEGVSTRADHTLKVTIGTQELSPEDAGRLFSLNRKLAYIVIKEETFNQSEIDAIEQLVVDSNDIKQKTPSQRLRSVLYVLWTSDNGGHPTFDTFYNQKMEIIVQHFKNKLDILSLEN
jgi:hypothetical protein